MRKPNYKRIYEDIINKKYPHKIEECQILLSKEELNFFDIIKLNQKIFASDESTAESQKHRSYDDQVIIKILQYQKDNMINNTQLALHFKLSRNTVAKWKKIFRDHPVASEN
ncbi:helix-turn-helix domain-containing protein [Chryseobacterium shigense]|uniref:Helix-turn-helix domain-containing protein n=1 Tax=Chryseobacterium shigense TaxID=297244 RepID=A0A841N3C1_9FLAO|nr:helix-turn-helix domain-containing protein [Chryseobacterium shigense]MBB6369643.1 hypothetical protein [Chryseobacterium shigense]